jgi:hypothetical protein
MRLRNPARGARQDMKIILPGNPILEWSKKENYFFVFLLRSFLRAAVWLSRLIVNSI